MAVARTGTRSGPLALLVLAACFAVGLLAHAARAADEDGRIVVAQIFQEPPLLFRLFGAKPKPVAPAPTYRVIRVPEEGLPGIQEGPGIGGPTRPKVIKPPKPKVVIPPKDADAKVVWVIGDELADGLARGLDVAFADTPALKIENGAVPGSGLATPDKVDWPRTLADRLASKRPDILVVMMGLADRSPIAVDGQPTDFRMAGWETVYRARVQSLVAAARARQVPVYWMGLAPMADFDLTTDIAFLDEIYRQETGLAFGTYVDVWNAFADETGAFSPSGPDVGGQIRQLRLKDGIGFTKSGNRKLAFYVEQEIRGWLKSGAAGPAAPVNTEAGLVVSLSDPEAGPDEELAGAGPAPEPKPGTALHDLLVLGKPPKPRPGRVDAM